MDMDASRWILLQKEISACADCVARWPEHITRPITLGEIPSPLFPINVLFVGVAPTDIKGRYQGTHFWSRRTDLLRVGLFRVLDDVLHLRLSEANERSKDEADAAFMSAGFFFVHSAKVRPIGMSAPPREAIAYCAARHLVREIEALAPQSVCFVGRNARSAARAIFGAEVGVAVRASRLDKWVGRVACGNQPRRGWDRKGTNPTAVVVRTLMNPVL
jgi:uracil-DNA glycosylase